MIQKKLMFEEFSAQCSWFRFVDAAVVKKKALDFAHKRNLEIVSVSVDFKLGSSGGGFREYTVTLWYYL